jgi:host factor-I protein
MDKPAQNIQDSFLNNARKDKIVLTIYLMSGVKLSGRIKSFDKYSLVLETNNQEQLIFKHAISTVVTLKTAHSYAASRRPARRCPRPPRRHPARWRKRKHGGLDLHHPTNAARTGDPGRGGLEEPPRRSAFRTGPRSESLEELSELAASAGAVIAGRVIQSRAAPEAATLIGQGKVQELAQLGQSMDAAW